MRSTLKASEILEHIANKKGYKVLGSPYDIHNVNETQKTITLQACITDERNIKMSHELGHIYTFVIWKWFIVLNEFTAWVVGYIICKIHRINTKEFWHIAKKCLKTYIKV